MKNLRNKWEGALEGIENPLPNSFRIKVNDPHEVGTVAEKYSDLWELKK